MAEASSSGKAAEALMRDSLGNPIQTTDLSKKKALSKSEIEALVKSVASTKIQDTVKDVESITDKDINPMEFSIYDFLGFNPDVIISVFIIISEHYGDSKSALVSDIKFCIAACLYMGNIQQKALTKRAAEGRAKLDYLCSKYNIVMGSTGSGIPAETVTFPRVVSSFPVLAVKMAKAVSPKAVNREFMSSSIPPYMRLTAFACLCSPAMNKELRLFLMEGCNAHGADMAIAYEVGRLKKAKKEIKYDPISLASDQWAFVEVCGDSPVPKEESKKALLTSLNLGKDFVVIQKVVANYRAIMQKKKSEEIATISEDDFNSQLSDYLTS